MMVHISNDTEIKNKLYIKVDIVTCLDNLFIAIILIICYCSNEGTPARETEKGTANFKPPTGHPFTLLAFIYVTG